MTTDPLRAAEEALTPFAEVVDTARESVQDWMVAPHFTIGACRRAASVLALIRAARAEPHRPAASPKWRPIETAPKDGTRIQLMCLKMPKFYTLPDILWIKVGSWRKHWQDGYEAGWREDALASGDDTGRVKITPTHWQPLPAAPSSAQAGEGR